MSQKFVTLEMGRAYVPNPNDLMRQVSMNNADYIPRVGPTFLLVPGDPTPVGQLKCDGGGLYSIESSASATFANKATKGWFAPFHSILPNPNSHEPLSYSSHFTNLCL